MNRVFRVVWNASLGVWQVASEITRSRGKTKSTRAGHGLRSVWSAVAAGSLLLFGLPGHAGALPTGGEIKSGTGSIASDGTRMNVSQETNKMVVDWQTFSIGSGNQVHFQQPSASAAVLNRVLGSQVSVIRGAMTANGRVFLVNPAGVVFTAGSTVDVGSLVASTLQITDSDFLSGNYRFSGSSGNAVLNQGNIRTKEGGFVALIAAKIENLGSIQASRGDVLLAAGSRVRLNMGGPVSIEVEAGAVDALIQNDGAIRADGGTVLLTAEGAGALTSLAINNQGLIEAVGLESGPGGTIRLAGGSGTTVNSGSIKASASAGQGGRVEITGARVELRDGSTVDASGATGGGTVLVGGDYQGQNADVPNALQTLVESGARIAADATVSGSGGRVIVWADGQTDFQGSISAKGAGASAVLSDLSSSTEPSNAEPVDEMTAAPAPVQGSTSGSGTSASADPYSALAEGSDPAGLPAPGAPTGPSSTPVPTTLVSTGRRDGGFAEVSGKRLLGFTGTVDLTTTAAEGQTGTLLLDPFNLTISASGENTGGSLTANTDNSVINVNTITNALSTANVQVTTGTGGSQDGNITVASDIGWFSSNTLTLDAAKDINLNASVFAFQGGLNLNSGGNITQANNTDINLQKGNFSAIAAGSITQTAAAGGGSTAGTMQVAGTTLLTATGGSVDVSSAGNKFTGAVSATSGATGLVNINNNQVTSLGAISAGSGGLTVTSAGQLTGSAALASAGGVNLSTTAAGKIELTGAFSATGNVSLSADSVGYISIADINGDVTIAAATAGGAITLGNSGTGVVTLGAGTPNATDGTTVITGVAGSGGQASGVVTVTGASINIKDDIRTKGGNLLFTATDAAGTGITASTGADIVTTADDNTGTTSGSVTLASANGMTLQAITTTGAANNVGVGSNASAVTLSATAGNINVGAITTSGGAAAYNASAVANRNGGNAGSIVIGATGAGADIVLNGDLNAIGGAYVGAATQGLGGYIEMQTDVVLSADRTVSSGATSGNTYFKGAIDSDGTARSLTVTAGTGDVMFDGVVGGTAVLKSLSSSGNRVDIEKNVTTNGSAGVAVSANSIRIGDDDLTNGSGAVTIDTEAGNGTASMSTSYLYLDDDVTFKRGTGAVTLGTYVFSQTDERNDLSFTGSNGGAVNAGSFLGGNGATPSTKLGNINVASGTDFSVAYAITAASLTAVNNTGRINLGNADYAQYYDGALGLNVRTTGTANNYGGDESITLGSNVVLSNAAAPLSVEATNGALTIYRDLTTAGGDVSLKAGGGALTLDYYTSIATSGGDINLTGNGVSQSTTDDVLNAGTGQIRIDGGGAGVDIRSRIITTYDEAAGNGTPAVLVNNATGVTVRSVEAQKGSFQVGIVAGIDALGAAQSGSSALTLLRDNLRLRTAQALTLTSAVGSNNAAVTFTIVGTDATGNVVTEQVTGPAGGATVTTTNSFKTIESITGGAAFANVSVGIAASDTVNGALSQAIPGWGDDQIDIKTLSAATAAAISITSTQNVIDELGDFVVGSSLDVRAQGRTAGMALTGDVTATAVTLMTGNGALVLGDRDITSTSGNVLLVGRGITQSAGSVITSAAETWMYGSDYRTATVAGMNLAGLIDSASNVYLYSANSLVLPNIDIGAAGARGTLTLGWDSYNSYPGSWNSWIYGNITQTAGTSIKVGTLQGRQTGGSGSYNLTNAGNEVQYVSYIHRGGAFSLNDEDTEGNGLRLNSSINDGSNASRVSIRTQGVFNLNGQQVYGDGVTIEAAGITGSGNLYGHAGSANGDITLIANGGNVTLSGDTYTDEAGNEIIIRAANNVQLGSRTHANGAGLFFGAGAVDSGIAQSQTLSAAGNLVIDGSLAGAGAVSVTGGGRVAVTSGSDETGVTFTVTGTDMLGRAQTEQIVGGNAALVSGTKYFATVTQISSSGATAGNVSVGLAEEVIAGNVTQTGRIESIPEIRGKVAGSVNLNRGDNSFGSVADLSAGGDLTLSSYNLTVTGDVASETGNVSITARRQLIVNSGATIAAATATKGVTLVSDTEGHNTTASIQGAVSAGSGGISLTSYYSGITTGTGGTLTTDGSVVVQNHYYGREISIGGAINAGVGGIRVDSAEGSVTTSATMTTGGSVVVESGVYDTTTVGGAVTAGIDGITITSGGHLNVNAALTSKTLADAGFVTLRSGKDSGSGNYDINLAADVVAGSGGIKLTSDDSIAQTSGKLVTSGALAGTNYSGNAPSSSAPSATGAVTLTGANEVGQLGPFYLHSNTTSSSENFVFNDATGGLTLAGSIENSFGAVTITTAGGALNLATYNVYAGGMASGGANIALRGQGIVQSAGAINATGGTQISPRSADQGGTITLTGHDGTASGTIALSGTISTTSNAAAAITIRGTSDLQLPNINAVNGGLVLGDDTATVGQISGNITQAVLTSLNVKTLNLGTATNAIGGSAVLANSGNKIDFLGSANVGRHILADGALPETAPAYDLDIYDSTKGLSLTQNVVSEGGVRIRTKKVDGDATSALAIGANDITAAGNVFLGGEGLTQLNGSVINADGAGNAEVGGAIRIEGGGSTFDISLAGELTTDNAGSTAIEIVNANNATLNTLSATAGTVALGVDGKELIGTVAQATPGTSTISAATLKGDAGVVTVTKSNIDNLGDFITTGALVLKDQGGAGTAGLTLTGNVSAGNTTEIQTTDGLLNLAARNITINDGLVNKDLTLRGVGVAQGEASSIKASTAAIHGGTGNIDLFSAVNDFTGQIDLNSTGAFAKIQDANNLSLNALTGKLDPTTSLTAWAGATLSLTAEDLTTTSGSIDLRSLGGNLSTPGNITTGSGDVTLIASGSGSNAGDVQVNNTIVTGSGNVTVTAADEVNLSKSIQSTSGDLLVQGVVVTHSTGSTASPLELKTGADGTITMTASGSGGLVMGTYFTYVSDTGDIDIASGGEARLSNLTSHAAVNVVAAGRVIQDSEGVLDANSLSVTATKNGVITLTNTSNDVNQLKLLSRGDDGASLGNATITYGDLDDVSVAGLETSGTINLTAKGNIATDATGFGNGTVLANTLNVKTLNDAGANIELTAATNDISILNLSVRNAADTAKAAGTSSISRFTDAKDLVVNSISTAGSMVLRSVAADGAVTQTGAIDANGLGLSGAGAFTLNKADTNVPVNTVNVFASDATGNVQFTTKNVLTIGSVNPVGITTGGADISITAPSIDSSGSTIDTRSGSAGDAGGSVSLTTTGAGADGRLRVGDIVTSGTNAAQSTDSAGGAAGSVTLKAGGDLLTIGGAITARGGAGDGSGATGAHGTVNLLAVSGAVAQALDAMTPAINAIDAGKVQLLAAQASALASIANTVDQLSARITGAGEGLSYASQSNYTVGGGGGAHSDLVTSGVTGISTLGGDVTLSGSPVVITVSEAITTRGGDVVAQGVGGFVSTGVAISTRGDVTYSSGTYKDGGDITIGATGNVALGELNSSGDSTAADATAGAITVGGDHVAVSNITATGQGTGAGGDVSLTASSAVTIAGTANTSGGGAGATQAAGGNIAVTGAAILSSDTTLNTGSGSGDVSFSSTINSDATARNLTITAGTGNVSVSGAVGDTAALSAVNVVSAQNVSLAAVNAASLTQQAGSGATTLGGAVSLTGNLAFSGNDLTVNAAAQVGGTTTITNAGTFTTAPAGDITSGGAFTQNGAGNSTLAGDINTGNADISFQSAVTLASDLAMSTDTGAGNVRFYSTVDGTQDLVISSGTGNVTFSEALGNVAALGDLTVNSGGQTLFSKTVTAASVLTDAAGTVRLDGGSVTTTGGTQQYLENLTLGANTTLTGTTITTGGTVNGSAGTGNNSLTVTGNAVFGNDSGDNLSNLGDLTVSGTTTINAAAVTSTGDQSYTGAVTIGADTTLTADQQNIHFQSTVDSSATGGVSDGNDLTVDVGTANTLATVTFAAAVGGVAELGNLTVTGAQLALNGGAVDTTSAQTYNGAVTLGVDTTLTGSVVTTTGTVDGAGKSLSVAGDAVLGDGTADTVSNVSVLSISGQTTIHTAVVTTAGAQTYTGAVIVGNDTTLTTTNSDVVFGATVDSEGAEANDLTVAAGTGNLTVSGAVGGTAALGAVNVVSANDVTLAAVDAASFTQQAGSGTTTLGGAVNLSGNLAFTGNNLTVNAAANVGDTATITNAGTFATAAAGDITSAGAFTQNGAGSNTLAGDITTGNADISFQSAVTLAGDLTMSTGTGAGNVTFSGTVDSAVDGNLDTLAHDLTISSGTGNVSFSDALGNVAALGDLTVNSGGQTLFSQTVTAASVLTDAAGSVRLDGGSVTTTGTQQYLENLTLGANTTLTGTTITTGGTVNGIAGTNKSLTVTGDAVFGNDSGDDLSDLGTLSVSGTTAIHASAVTSMGAQTYTGAVIVGNDTTLTTTNSDVSFGASVDSEGAEANDLTVAAGTGNLTVSGAVGGTAALGAVNVVSANDVTLAAVDAASFTQQAGSGTTTLGGAVNLSGNLAFTGNDLTVNDVANLGGDLTFTGHDLAVNAAANVGGTTTITNAGTFSTLALGDITSTGAFTQNGVGSNTLAGDITTGNADISFQSAVTLAGDLAMSTGTGAGNVTFSGTVDSAVDGNLDTLAHDLTISSGTGGVSFSAALGNVAALGDLTVNSGGQTLFSQTVTAASVLTDAAGSVRLDGGSVTTTGTQQYLENLTLGADTTLTGTTITTGGTVNGIAGTNHSLTVTGDAVFGNDSGDDLSDLGTLSVSGTTAIHASAVTSTGAQTYTGAVIVGNDTTLTTTNSDVVFGATVDSEGAEANDLTVAAGTGNITLSGALGNVVALGNLSLTGGGIELDGGVLTTADDQTYSGNVVLGADTTLTSQAGSIQLNGSVDSAVDGNLATLAHDLTLAAYQSVTLGADVGSVNAIGNLAVTAPTIHLGANVTTVDDQTYTGNLVVAATDATLTGDALTVTGTIDSLATVANNLHLVFGNTAGINFHQAVGGQQALGSLTIESAGVITQSAGATIKAAKLGIKSAGNATLDLANDVDVLAALLSGNASLVFTDVDGVQIGEVPAGSLSILGISDGAGTSHVTLTVGGLLTQQTADTGTGHLAAPVDIDGNFTIDTRSNTANGDVTIHNGNSTGTVLDDTFVAGDFTLTGGTTISQKDGGYLQVGGAFETGSAVYSPSTSADNFIGGGGSGDVTAENVIKLYGVVTLSMNANGDLLATATRILRDSAGVPIEVGGVVQTQTTTDTITASALATYSNVQVISDAGGKMILFSGAGDAVVLAAANNKIGGMLKVTTAGSYDGSGVANETGILQSSELTLTQSLTLAARQNDANATSTVAGAGQVRLDDVDNALSGAVSIATAGSQTVGGVISYGALDVSLVNTVDTILGTVSAKNLVVEVSGDDLSQTGAIQAQSLLVLNADDITLASANRIGTVAAETTGNVSLGLGGNSATTVGTVADFRDGNVSVSGINTTAGTTDGSITIKSSVDVVVDQAINAGTSSVTLLATDGTNLSLGSATGGWNLSEVELAKITGSGTTLGTEGDGTLVVGDLAAPASLGNVVLDSGTAGIELGGNLSLAGVNLTLNDPVRLTADVSVRTGSGAGDVVFGSTVDSSGNGETGNLAVSDYHSLTVEAGTGSVAFNGALGGQDDGALGNLTVTSASSITLNDATVADAVALTATDDVTFNGNLAVVGNGGAGGTLSVTSTNGDITDGVNGSLTVAGTTTLDAGTGNVVLDSALSDFNTVNVTDAGNVAISDADGIALGDVNSSGLVDINANGNVTLDGTITAGSLDIDSTNGDITDGVNANVAVSGATTLDAGTGNVVLDSALSDFNTVNV
ncbi:filamentous hemagglutinin N-terminal domain-containing protein, partial [Hydrogenophaga sp.]|uniref:filamentous hemagglutinin N-terminal domain-containing protein n=1 Tax=Hydrogenophaga sp. TaxID=1904254 RepID=UPI00286DB642